MVVSDPFNPKMLWKTLVKAAFVAEENTRKRDQNDNDRNNRLAQRGARGAVAPPRRGRRNRFCDRFRRCAARRPGR